MSRGPLHAPVALSWVSSTTRWHVLNLTLCTLRGGNMACSSTCVGGLQRRLVAGQMGAAAYAGMAGCSSARHQPKHRPSNGNRVPLLRPEAGYTHTHARMRTRACTHTHAHSRTHIHTHTRTHTHTHTQHTHTHTYTHTTHTHTHHKWTKARSDSGTANPPWPASGAPAEGRPRSPQSR